LFCLVCVLKQPPSTLFLLFWPPQNWLYSKNYIRPTVRSCVIHTFFWFVQKKRGKNLAFSLGLVKMKKNLPPSNSFKILRKLKKKILIWSILLITCKLLKAITLDITIDSMLSKRNSTWLNLLILLEYMNSTKQILFNRYIHTNSTSVIRVTDNNAYKHFHYALRAAFKDILFP